MFGETLLSLMFGHVSGWNLRPTTSLRYVREEMIMREISIIFALSLVLAPGTAFAQNQPTVTTNYKGLTKDDLKSVCVYNDSVYSPGSIVCIGKGVAIFCGVEKTPTWSILEKDNPSTSACAKQ